MLFLSGHNIILKRVLFKIVKLQLRITLFFALFSVLSAFAVPKTFADDCVITDAPNLYQVNRSKTEATLFFTPINDNIQSYSIIYGFKPEDERFSTTFNLGASTGAVSYTIGDLDPKLGYYFEVRANTSCTSSPWSNWRGDKIALAAAAKASSQAAKLTPGANITLIGAIASLALIATGAFVFKFSSKLA